MLQAPVDNEYHLDAFNAVRALLAPKGILSNELMDIVLACSIVKSDTTCDYEHEHRQHQEHHEHN